MMMMYSTTPCEATGLREACSLSLHIWPLPDSARPEDGDMHVLNYCNPIPCSSPRRCDRRRAHCFFSSRHYDIQQDAGHE